MIKKIFFNLFLVFSICGTAHAESLRRIEIKVPEMISVNADSPLHLRDIVTLEPDSVQSSIWQKLTGVSVDLSVPEGKTVSLDAKMISQVIRSELTFSELKMISLRLPAEVLLSGKKNHLSLTRLKTEILMNLQKQCDDCSFEFAELRTPEKTEDFMDWSLSIPQGKIVRSPQAKIILMTRKNESKEYNLGLQVAALKPYLVATKKIESGQPVQESDFTTRLLDMAQMTDISPVASELNGRKLNRTLMPGDVLYNSHLNKLFLVKAGIETKGVFEEGAIKLELAVVPQSNGSLGETISVKSVLTQKNFSAQVLENGKVLIK